MRHMHSRRATSMQSGAHALQDRQQLLCWSAALHRGPHSWCCSWWLQHSTVRPGLPVTAQATQGSTAWLMHMCSAMHANRSRGPQVCFEHSAWIHGPLSGRRPVLSKLSSLLMLVFSARCKPSALTSASIAFHAKAATWFVAQLSQWGGEHLLGYLLAGPPAACVAHSHQTHLCCWSAHAAVHQSQSGSAASCMDQIRCVRPLSMRIEH